MSKRWRALSAGVIALLLLGLIVGRSQLFSFTEHPDQTVDRKGLKVERSHEKESGLTSKSRPLDPKREQSRLLKSLEKDLRRLEYGRIVNTAAGVQNIRVSDGMRASYRFPKEQGTTRQQLRSVAVRAPDEMEAEAIRQLVSKTFDSTAFAGESGLDQQRQRYLDTYLNFPKKLKILLYNRLEVARLRDSFLISSYNSDECLENPRDQGSELRPLDFDSEEEDSVSRLETNQRYRHLFDLKE